MPSGEIDEDGVGLGEQPPVVEFEQRALSHRVAREEVGRAGRAVARRDLVMTERAAEKGHHQARLVAVAAVLHTVDRRHGGAPFALHPVVAGRRGR